MRQTLCKELIRATSFNKMSLREGGDEDNPKHRYQWEAHELSCHETDLPHSIVVSTHMCKEPRQILRSELMILLFTMRGAGEFARHLEKEITPVCTWNFPCLNYSLSSLAVVWLLN